MFRLLPYMKKYRLQSVLAPFFKMTEAVFELFVPLIVAKIIDEGIGGNDEALIVRYCLLLALLALAGLALAVAAQFFSARAAVGFASEVRKGLYKKVFSLPASESDRLGTNRLITMLTGDVVQLQTGVNMVLRLFMRSPVVVIGAVVMAFIADPRGLAGGGLWFLVAVPLLALAVGGVMIFSIRRYKASRSSVEDLTLELRENLSGMRVFRSFGQEEHRKKRFEKMNDAASRALVRAGRVSALTGPFTMVIVDLGIVALLWSGAVSVKAGALSTGKLIALYNYMTQILIELIKLANLIVTVTKSAACADRVGRVLALDASLAKIPPELSGGEEEIAFEHVDLTYPDGTKALKDVSFSIGRGQTLGIIGGTGAGKSSVISLIMRYYDPTGGRILCGGRDLRSLDESALRARIGLVPQKPELFRGTVAENLRFGDPSADDETLWDALTAADADGIVRSKAGGLDAEVEQYGRNFSGGQKQRLTVARALVRRPEILILDDSFSALDYATEAKLKKSLSELSYRPTTVIVSQRASSLRRADRILVLDEGGQVGLGTHEELYASCPVYREICLSQESEGGDAQ
ncbi:MAG: ABC transporter ATP-binding protein [Clostridia bacterium]|nr:ABC transporter ATP-binding protein [Clostridia bacterium]